MTFIVEELNERNFYSQPLSQLFYSLFFSFIWITWETSHILIDSHRKNILFFTQKKNCFQLPVALSCSYLFCKAKTFKHHNGFSFKWFLTLSKWMASIDALFIICDLLTDHIDRLSIRTFALCIIMTLTFLKWLSYIELVFFTYFSIVVVFLSLQNQKCKEKNMPIWLAIQMILSINTRLIVSYAWCVVKFHLLWLYWFLVCYLEFFKFLQFSFKQRTTEKKKHKIFQQQKYQTLYYGL